MADHYRFIAKTEVVIGRSQPEPRSGEGCDQADHGRPVEAMKVFLATVSQTNGRGPRCTEADQAGIEAPVLLWNSTTPRGRGRGV